MEKLGNDRAAGSGLAEGDRCSWVLRSELNSQSPLCDPGQVNHMQPQDSQETRNETQSQDRALTQRSDLGELC